MQIINEEELAGIKISSKLSNSGTVYLFYEGPITANFVPYLLEELRTNDDGYNNVILFLNSAGGDTAFINPFCTVMKEFNLVGVCGIGQASSAALAIMLMCLKNNISVYIDPCCHIILHRVICTWLGEGRYDRIEEYNNKWVKNYEEIFDQINEPLLSKLSKKERDDYKAGHNVYLLGIQLIELEMFKDIKELKNGKEKKSRK